MAATDQVPCFYTGQDYRIERPADVLTRAEVRELKAQKRGKFVENGKLFIFSEVRAKGGELFWDGLLGTGNLLPFAKVSNPMCKPETINYPIPAAGAHTRLLRCQTSLLFREARFEDRAFNETRSREAAS